MLLICLVGFSVSAQKKVSLDYYRFMDSADVYVEEDSQLARQFLDSISEPIEEKIGDSLARYYMLQGFINSRYEEKLQLYQNYLLALKHAKATGNYDIAGEASLELFYNIYLVKGDSVAYKYLDDAKKYYTRANNKNGLLEVTQMPAYVAYHKDLYEESNRLLTPHLADYKNVKEDAYYYLYALFMLTSNHLHLGNQDSTYKYFAKLKSLEYSTALAQPLYNLHLVTLYGCMAHIHLEDKAKDSALIYLQKGDKLKAFMNESDRRNHLEAYIDYHNAMDNFEAKRAYVDSLRLFESSLVEKSLGASLKMNDALIQVENVLKLETEKKRRNRNFVIVFGALLLLLVLFIVLRYKVIREKINDFTRKDNEFSFFKKNHETLKAKVQGLEDYISEVKKEVKIIAAIDDVKAQQKGIKELYKNIHHNSSTLITKGESHFEIINELNVDFFNKLSTKHPELNQSEIIICYYIYAGFKNKEIAGFLNTSERAIESKRFRIRKKLDLQGNNAKLVKYLQNQILGN